MRRLLMGVIVILAAAGASAARAEQAVAIFAGGCFWCVESDFDKVPGVLSTTSGYTGGKTKNPTYNQVSAGDTGHTEAVRISYDPAKVTYRQLLDFFWRHHDPLVKNAQFCDRGSQYRAAIFVQNDAERLQAEASKKEVQGILKKPVVTEISAAGPFYPAEDYHQDFYEKNAVKYKFYRWNCGRDQRIEQIWGSQKGEG